MDRKRIAPVVVVLVAAAAAGYYFWSQRAATPTGPGVTVSGTVDAEQVQVASLVSGRIVEANLAEGDRVTGGQVLYRIDSRALEQQLKQAEAALDAAQVAYDEAKKHDDPKADRAAARAVRDQAKAAVSLAKVQLGYARVTAPATGTVTAVALGAGELATPGKTLATITRMGDLFVRAFVLEPDMGSIAVGDSASIATDSGARVLAKITFVASEAQFTPSNVETKDQRAKLVYEVRLVPETVEGLTPGMPVTVTIGQ